MLAFKLLLHLNSKTLFFTLTILRYLSFEARYEHCLSAITYTLEILCNENRNIVKIHSNSIKANNTRSALLNANFLCCACVRDESTQIAFLYADTSHDIIYENHNFLFLRHPFLVASEFRLKFWNLGACKVFKQIGCRDLCNRCEMF